MLSITLLLIACLKMNHNEQGALAKSVIDLYDITDNSV